MIAKMLRNPRYAGMVSYAGKHRVQGAMAGDGWSLVLFDDQGRPLLGTWEPIVTPKLWSQVQFEWQRRRQKAGIKPVKSGSAPVNKYLLSGILRCHKCHRGLVGHSYKQRRSRKDHPQLHVPAFRSRRLQRNRYRCSHRRLGCRGGNEWHP